MGLKEKIVNIIFVIGITIIVCMGMHIYNEKKLNNISDNDVFNQTKNNVFVEEENKELKLGNYDADEKKEDEMGVSYEECGVTLAENNLCSVYQGWGTSNIGTYSIENNKLICNTIIKRSEGGGIFYVEENIVYEFEIVDEDTVKLVNVIDYTGNGYSEFGLTKGMTYSFSGKNKIVLVEN